MNLKEKFIKYSFLFSFIPIRWLINTSKIKVFFPFYHAVSDYDLIHIKHLYTVKTIREFESDLKFFKKNFTPISLNKYLNGEVKNCKKPFLVLSFDDGLNSVLKNSFALLSHYNIPFICFINSDFIDNRSLFYRFKVSLLIECLKNSKISETQKFEIASLFNKEHFNKNFVIIELYKMSIKNLNVINKIAEILNVSFQDYLIKNRPYLTEEEVNVLIKSGVLIGAHSKSHPRYKDICLSEQLLETFESVNEIKNQFKINIKLFSFPFSDDGVSQEFFEEVNNNRIILFGSAGLKNSEHKMHFQRIPMEYKSVYSAERIIRGELIYFLIKKLLFKT